MILWGIDLGGTKIECSVFEITNTDKYKLIYKERLPTESTKGYGHILSQIKLLVSNVESATKLKSTAIGISSIKYRIKELWGELKIKSFAYV